MSDSTLADDPRANMPSMSGNERLLNCPGSVRLSRGLSSPEKSWTRDGSLGHAVLAGAAEEEELEGHEDVASLVARCEAMAEQITEELGFSDAEHVLTEERLWLHDDEGNAVASGQPDRVLIKGKAALIFDWKLGRNEVAPAPNNPQTIGYALLLQEEYGISEAKMVIIQPWRKPQPAGHIDAAGMALWRTALLDAVAAAQEENAPRNPGSWCDYCPARPICPEARAVASRVTLIGGGELAPMNIAERFALIGPEEKLRLWDWTKHAEKTLKEIIEFYRAELTRDPDSIPGLRIKPGAEQVKIAGSAKTVELLRGLNLSDDQILASATFSLPKLAAVKANDRPGTKKLSRAGEDAKKDIKAALGDLAEITTKRGSIEHC